jgi:hypothetical protein
MPRIQPGDRIVLLSMPHDPDPVPVGTEGTVEKINDVGPVAFTQVEVRWDNGRRLMLSMPPDEVRVIHPSASRH